MNTLQKEGAKACFDYDQDLQTIIATEDGNCFTDSSLANNHNREQRFQSDPITISREDIYSEENEQIEAEGTDQGEKQENETLATKPFNRMNKQELRAICTKEEIEYAEEDTNAVLIEKIEAKQKSELEAANVSIKLEEGK